MANIQWTLEDSATAAHEGWRVVEADDTVYLRRVASEGQAEVLFDSDEAAQAFVAAQAAAGDALALKAVSLLTYMYSPDAGAFDLKALGVLKPQPKPETNNRQAVWDLVIGDMRARDRAGAAKYGTRLQTFNGRNFMSDAVEEVLDLAVYLRGAQEEIRELRSELLEFAQAQDARALMERLLAKYSIFSHA